MYQHQDWKTVVLNKRPEAVVTKTVGVGGKSGGYGGSTSTSGKPAWKVESMVDSDVGKPVDALQFVHEFYALGDRGMPLKVKKSGKNKVLIKLDKGLS